jgi:ketosteroid isomerase-like protein
MTTAISRELVQTYFEACVSRDPERIGRCLHDNVDWSLAGPVDVLPYCGQRHGKSQVVDTIVRLVPSSIRLTGIKMEDILIDGDRAAAFLRVSAIHAGTGRTVSYRAAQLMRFRDGKLVESRAVIDSFDAAEQVLGHPISASPAGAAQDFPSSGNRIAI